MLGYVHVICDHWVQGCPSCFPLPLYDIGQARISTPTPALPVVSYYARANGSQAICTIMILLRQISLLLFAGHVLSSPFVRRQGSRRARDMIITPRRYPGGTKAIGSRRSGRESKESIFLPCWAVNLSDSGLVLVGRKYCAPPSEERLYHRNWPP